MYYGLDVIGLVLIGISILISLSASVFVNKTYSKYKKVKVEKDITGCEVARQILDANGLSDVYVVESSGMLSDHYDPKRKVVKLSKDNFHGSSVAACAVAAHEVGHAIQDKKGYSFMRFRSFLVPFANFGSNLGYVAIFIGFIFGAMNFVWGGIGLLLLLLLFQLVTLPVEFDASKRAVVELKKIKVLTKEELVGGNKMLKAAAYTYVAAVLTTVLELLRLVLMAMGRSD